MKMVNQQDAFLKNVMDLLRFTWNKGFKVTGGELMRTVDQQGLYYARGLTKTMDSKHLKKLAIDLNFFYNNVWVTDKSGLQEIGDYWEWLDERNQWGGNWTGFPDMGHFQRDPE